MTHQTGILPLVGNTPLIQLTRLNGGLPFRLFAKLELLNIGGSIKDRPAFGIVQDALDKGLLKPGMTIVESSSGNFGIGLSQACAYFGLNFICVVDPKATKQNLQIMQAYGAKIELVDMPNETGGYLQARIDRVHELLDKVPDSYWCNQYNNLNNPKAHHKTIGEIMTALNHQVDYLFCATSTCGTLRGFSEYISEHNLNTKIVAVDAQGSVIFGDQPKNRLIPGHGAGRVPELFTPNYHDEFILVSDLDCVVGCRRLLKDEVVLAGGSSGGIISAVLKKAPEIEPDATCAAIICDRGERYLETVYSDAWVTEHFGDVAHLWQ